MGRGNRGLLFGPREAGCWQTLLTQAFSCGLLAAALGWWTGNRAAWHIAGSFLSEGLAIVLLLTSAAQLFWLEERFPRVPLAWIGYSVPAALALLVVGGVCGQVLLAQLGLALLALMLGLLLLSIALRLVLALWDF